MFHRTTEQTVCVASIALSRGRDKFCNQGTMCSVCNYPATFLRRLYATFDTQSGDVVKIESLLKSWHPDMPKDTQAVVLRVDGVIKYGICSGVLFDGAGNRVDPIIK